MGGILFLADAMLGKLARWLRILGYDTLYNTRWDDDEIARRARAEGRIVLTRDTGLVQRKGLVALYVESEQWPAQVRQVLQRYRLPDAPAFSRCPVDNELLQAITRASAQPLVPPYVYRTQAEFRRCPRCGRVYWRGTHWARMQEELKNIGAPNGL